jgi:orotate phosphoribosyltransferase
MLHLSRKIVNFSRAVARASFEAGAISVGDSEQFTGATGVKLPVYNDNRKLLGSYAHRMLVADAYADVIAKKNITFDLIAGTSLSGIAPATSLAQKLKKPIVFLYKDKPLLPTVSDECIGPFGGADLVVGSAPFGIAASTIAANRHRLPLAYVREQRKEHGLQRQLEGKYSTGQRAHLIGFYLGELEERIPLAALKSEGLRVVSSSINATSPRFVDVAGTTVLLIEDLMTTGTSSAKEAKRYEELGANVEHCISLYGPSEPVAFKDTRCTSHIVVSLEDALAEAELALCADEFTIFKAWHEQGVTR